MVWRKVHDIGQEIGIKAIPKKKKFKKTKWLSEEALQIAVERREAKSKGERERYSHLNAEFQRIWRLHIPISNSTLLKKIKTKIYKI